jgi:hypothetical protein
MITIPTSIQTCPFCGGIHNEVCSKIKSIEYNPDGTYKKVDFHPPGFPTSPEINPLGLTTDPFGHKTIC